jgi:hypothetical protein
VPFSYEHYYPLETLEILSPDFKLVPYFTIVNILLILPLIESLGRIAQMDPNKLMNLNPGLDRDLLELS